MAAADQHCSRWGCSSAAKPWQSTQQAFAFAADRLERDARWPPLIGILYVLVLLVCRSAEPQSVQQASALAAERLVRDV